MTLYERHVSYTWLRRGPKLELVCTGEYGGKTTTGYFEQDWQGLWIWWVPWRQRWYGPARSLIIAVRAAGLWDALKVIRSRAGERRCGRVEVRA